MNLAPFFTIFAAIIVSEGALCPGPTNQGLNPVCMCQGGSVCPSNSYCFRNNVYYQSICCPYYNAYASSRSNGQYQQYNNYNAIAQPQRNVYRNIPQSVENQIASNTVLIYGRSTCGYCQRAKRTMKQYDGRIPYSVIEYDYLPNGNELINYVVKRTGQDTVPQVFICGQFIGGATQLQYLDRSGELYNRAMRCSSKNTRSNKVMSRQPNLQTNRVQVQPPPIRTIEPTNPNAIRLSFPGGYISEVVKKQIAQNGVLLYTRSTCSYCKKARALLDVQYPNLVYHFFEIDTTPAGYNVMAQVIKRTGSSTVPQIFVCGQYLGGSDRLESLHVNGQLRDIFERCVTNTVYGNRAPNNINNNALPLRRKNFFKMFK